MIRIKTLEQNIVNQNNPVKNIEAIFENKDYKDLMNQSNGTIVNMLKKLLHLMEREDSDFIVAKKTKRQFGQNTEEYYKIKNQIMNQNIEYKNKFLNEDAFLKDKNINLRFKDI